MSHHGRPDGQMNGRTDRRTDGRMGGRTHIFGRADICADGRETFFKKIETHKHFGFF